MTFTEPAGRQAVTAYRTPLRVPDPWLTLAGGIEPQVAQCFPGQCPLRLLHASGS